LRTTLPRLVVIGAGGHGAEVAGYLQDLSRHGSAGEFVGYLDDDPAPQCRDAPVIGGLSALLDCPPAFFEDLRYLTAMGNNATRRRVVGTLERLYGRRLTAWTLVHPSCCLGPQVEVGAGTCLAPGAIVTCGTRIGRHCIVNVKASVSHDCTVGDFVNLNPSVTVCGNVTIGDGAYIGAGATIIERVSVGAGAIVGAGSVVIRDVPPEVTVVGAPARVIKQHLVSV